jgi:hypothetical protein
MYHGGMAARVPIPLRVSQDIADSIDTVRGGQTRAAWVEHAIDLALREAKPAAKRKADPDACPHPRGRVIKGFCYLCGKPAT